MNKKIVIIGIALILVSIGLSGCNEVQNSPETDISKFIGTWKSEDKSEVITFFSDNTFSGGTSFSGTWELKDGKLVISLLGGEFVDTYDYIFFNDTTLGIRKGPREAYAPLYKQ
jgi:hypothetical protein